MIEASSKPSVGTPPVRIFFLLYAQGRGSRSYNNTLGRDYSDHVSHVAAPLLSTAGVTNVAGSGGAALSLSGLGFRSSGATPTAVSGGVVCGTAAWTSMTSVLCATASKEGNDVAMTVSGVSSTMLVEFSYDGACAYHIGLVLSSFFRPLLGVCSSGPDRSPSRQRGAVGYERGDPSRPQLRGNGGHAHRRHWRRPLQHRVLDIGDGGGVRGGGSF